VDFDDMGEPAETCQMCEVAEIRYVHYMRHPDYPMQLGCGCVCAERMEQDYVGPRRREAEAKNRTSRRDRWLRRDWKTSQNGNEYLKTRDGFVVIMWEHRNGWAGVIKDSISGHERVSNRRYGTAAEFKLAAFDAMPTLKKRWRD
jgi:hypothetical protein